MHSENQIYKGGDINIIFYTISSSETNPGLNTTQIPKRNVKPPAKVELLNAHVMQLEFH